MSKATQYFRIAVIILVCWFSIHLCYTISSGLTASGETSDVAVIMGNKVNEDGTLSPRLTERMKCGLSLYQHDRVKRIIVSGGLGKEGYYEGDKMKEYLVRNGVPDSVVIIDNKGNSTELSVNNTLSLQKQLHFKRIIVVSQYYHLLRCRMLFRKAGFRDVDSARPYYFEWRDIYSLIREFGAFYSELI